MDYSKIEGTHDAVKPHAQAVLAIRNTLIDMIRAVVEKQNGCIGTFYKNLGEHHTKDQTEEEWDNSPIVAIQNPTYNCYGGFEGNTVYDIFFHPEDCMLLVTLNGEAGEDFDEPIENVQAEGLLCIVSWLAEKGFVGAKEEDPWCCVECGSLEVEQKVWIDPNTEKMTAQDGVDSGDCWCNDCQEHTSQTQESNLLSRIEEWWTYADYETRVDVTGLFDDMFASLNEHDKAMKEHWVNLTKEEKMAIWKSKIYGKI